MRQLPCELCALLTGILVRGNVARGEATTFEQVDRDVLNEIESQSKFSPMNSILKIRQSCRVTYAAKHSLFHKTTHSHLQYLDIDHSACRYETVHCRQ